MLHAILKIVEDLLKQADSARTGDPRFGVVQPYRLRVAIQDQLEEEGL